MALSKYTETLIRGFNTSLVGAANHHSAALRINNAVDTFDMLNADNSRTRSEKAPMYKKLQEKHGKAINDAVARMGKDILSRTETYEGKVSKVMTSMSLVESVQLVASLKAAGLSTDQIRATIADSAEVAVAFARAPQALTGFSKEVAQSAALKHFPELTEEEAELSRDYSAFQSLSKNAEKTIREIGYNIDEQALAARFDESALDPKAEPVTAADVNAQEAGE